VPFGVGITPPASKGGAKVRSDGRGARGTGRSGRDGDVHGARPGESSDELAARITRAEEPPSTAATTLLLALAVLLPAALLALLLMQRAQVSRTGTAA
jgi:hypothetical protein